MEHSIEKQSIRDRLKSRFMRAKLAGAAMAVGAAGMIATAGGVAAESVAAEPTALAKFAADVGMTVPSLFVFVLLVISFLGIITGYARTQMMYYITAGIGVLWLIMLWLGL